MTDRHEAGGSTRFNVREVDTGRAGVRCFALGGIFTDCPQAYDFLTELRADLEEDESAVVLDLSDVPHMTSGGVGILAALFTLSREVGRSMSLTGMRSRLTDVMKVTRLLPIIPSFDTLDEALQAAVGPDANDSVTESGGTSG